MSKVLVDREVAQSAFNELLYANVGMKCRESLRAALEQPGVGPIDGDILPPIGSRVFIRHGRDDDAHACTVTGYYAWGDLGGDKYRSRVFVRLVYEGTSVPQARILCDCYPSAEAALNNTAPQPTQQPDTDKLLRQALECIEADCAPLTTEHAKRRIQAIVAIRKHLGYE